MNEQPEALRLADMIERYNAGVHSQAIVEDYSRAADELRRLHEADEAFGKRQEWWNDRMFEMETALRQAVEALEAIAVDAKTTSNAYETARQAIAAAKQALGEAMSIDAMKLALEALELWSPALGHALNKRAEAVVALRAAIEQANEFNPDWDAMAVMVEEQQRMAKRIEELETYKRLYELRGKALERPCTNCGHQPAKIKTMEQPEQHEQTLMDALIGGTGVMLGDKRIDPASIYKQPEQEPVSFNHDIGSDRFKVVRGAFWWHVLIGDSPTEHGKFRSRAGAEKMAADLLREFRNGAFVQHTSPRQWQGLTDDEIDKLRHLYDGTAGWTIERFARAIEAKLKEKNHG